MWKNIVGYENYKINRAGIIKNAKGSILRTHVGRFGNKNVNLYKNKKSKCLGVKKLIRQNFDENDNFDLLVYSDSDFMVFSKTSFFRHIPQPRIDNYSAEEIISVLEEKASKNL